jgi:hypothetical protein
MPHISSSLSKKVIRGLLKEIDKLEAENRKLKKVKPGPWQTGKFFA